MIIIIVQQKFKSRIEEALLETWDNLMKLPYLHLIVDTDNPYEAQFDLLDFLWGDPSGHVIVLYGPTPQRFKEDDRVTRNHVIDSPDNWWVKAKEIYESINGKIQP